MTCNHGEDACPPAVVGQCHGNSDASADVMCPFGTHQNASVVMGNTTEACCVFDIVVVEFELDGDPVSKEDVLASILQLLDSTNASSSSQGDQPPNISLTYTQKATAEVIFPAAAAQAIVTPSRGRCVAGLLHTRACARGRDSCRAAASRCTVSPIASLRSGAWR